MKRLNETNRIAKLGLVVAMTAMARRLLARTDLVRRRQRASS
jgi:hypothetical protein